MRVRWSAAVCALVLCLSGCTAVVVETAPNASATKREGTDRVINDVWIETKISAQLITAKEVTSVNYRWRSVRSTVYLIGRAQSRTELNTVVSIARATDGVSQVKQFIELSPRVNS